MAAIATILVFGGWLASLVGGIMILVEAFKESTGQGFLSLLVPFYAFYYVFTRWDDCKKGFLINVAGVVAVIAGTMFGAGAMLTAS